MAKIEKYAGDDESGNEQWDKFTEYFNSNFKKGGAMVTSFIYPEKK